MYACAYVCAQGACVHVSRYTKFTNTDRKSQWVRSPITLSEYFCDSCSKGGKEVEMEWQIWFYLVPAPVSNFWVSACAWWCFVYFVYYCGSEKYSCCHETLNKAFGSHSVILTLLVITMLMLQDRRSWGTGFQWHQYSYERKTFEVIYCILETETCILET